MAKIPAFLSDHIECKAIENLSLDQVLSSFRAERALVESAGRSASAVDPRNGEPVVFNPARASRPHDYPVPSGSVSPELASCPICRGETTGVLDWAELEEGITFINKNLYPILPLPGLGDDERGLQGLHFVQWTSSNHSSDWYNLPQNDCVTVLGRLAVLENTLLGFSTELEERRSKSGAGTKDSWHVSIIKNVGAAVGGSLEHGHQQIILGNVTPRRILADQEFKAGQGISFAQYLIRETPPELIVRDYGGAVLLVAQFMRRPYEMVLAVTDPDKSHLRDLEDSELRAVARGWQEASQAIRGILPELHREVAYNVVAHNGISGGLYFEFLPYTQEQGGLEQLGMAVCQATPAQAADRIRQRLG